MIQCYVEVNAEDAAFTLCKWGKLNRLINPLPFYAFLCGVISDRNMLKFSHIYVWGCFELTFFVDTHKMCQKGE